MSRVRDAVVVGGGPAGLYFAAAAAARGLDVTVLEKGEGPQDKACGEGLLPAGRRALQDLGVLELLDKGEASPIREIRYCDSDGREVGFRLPGEGGIGIRRTALSAVLRERALALGAEVLCGAEVLGQRRAPGFIAAQVGGLGELRARVLVAADGLASPVRRREGLDVPVRGRKRFGLRRHFSVARVTEAVEVHFGEGAEAYLTPVGSGRVGVAILFERGGRVRYPDLLARFPALEARLLEARACSELRGAGPFARRALRRVADRLVLLGDAAGYLDAVTGEGLSMAFGCATDLAHLLPGALASGADARSLLGYERAWRRRYLRYAFFTKVVLGLSRRPALRRGVLRLAAGGGRVPLERLFAAALAER